MKRAIIHIDGDGFFASCEIALNPKLKGKAVVTGRERGIATAMSQEAKTLGIFRGMPIFKIKKLYPEAVVVESNYHHYGMFAQRMYDIVRRYTDLVEEYSIDECFADITGLEKKGVTYTDIARSIKDTLKNELGMTFSLGLGPTKVIAKVASKWNKPDGFSVITSEEIPNFLKDLQVGKVWGIGPQTSLALNRLGIKTALDLIERPEAWIKEYLSKPYLEIWNELKGDPVYEVHTDTDVQASIQVTRTFTPPSDDKNFLFSELSKNVLGACSKARDQGLEARRIYYFLKTQEFRFHRFEIPLERSTNLPNEVLDAIKSTFDMVYRPDVPYRATGVTLSGLIPEAVAQNDLFGGGAKSASWQKVFETADKLDRRYGHTTLVLGSALEAYKRRGERPERLLRIPFMGEVA